MAPPTDSDRLGTFDGMRGLAALLVALYHFQQHRGIATIPGYLAVDLFFVLSGFVIAARYGPLLADGMTLADFWRSRLVRLYPLYLAGLALGIVAQASIAWRGEAGALSPAGGVAALGFGLVLLPDPFHKTLFPLNGTAWSLFFELLVNLVFATTLHRLGSRWLVAIAATAALILAMTVHPPDCFNIGWDWKSFPGGLMRATGAFAAGMLVFRWASTARRPETTAAVLPLLAMAAPILLLPHRADWQLLVVVLLFPVLVAWAARVEPPARLRGAFLRAGDLSYAIYAINLPLLEAFRPLIRAVPAWLGGAMYLAVLVGLAHLLTRWFDGPVRATLDARRRGRPLAAAGNPA
ncbi:acyltransferase [Sphingomonas sp.]|uniref:acyltransferase family protein n=1 Tax=Sphingomonas sp. TaxID=28214 RepID=UPI001B1D5D4E|nr:acyltransferase [Sphingomonas sp.]MBO9712578.1 acyltransferase [Sphingomonas sp.]